MALALASLTASDIEQSTRIGWMFWHYIGESAIAKETAVGAFASSGLPNRYAFPVIRPVDAYRRASKSIEGSAPSGLAGTKLTFLVRDVYHDPYEIVRHLVLEIRDENGKRLDYDPKAALLLYNRELSCAEVVLLRADEATERAARTFLANYQTYKGSYDSSAVRRTIGLVLKESAAVSLKESGGVYLVPRTHEAQLFALMRLLDALPTCKGYRVNVENNEHARDMVRDAVTRQAQGMLGEMRSLLQADVVSPERLKETLERSKQIKQQTKVYQAILAESLCTLDTDVELLEAQMLRLLEEKL